MGLSGLLMGLSGLHLVLWGVNEGLRSLLGGLLTMKFEVGCPESGWIEGNMLLIIEID